MADIYSFTELIVGMVCRKGTGLSSIAIAFEVADWNEMGKEKSKIPLACVVQFEYTFQACVKLQDKLSSL